MKLKNQYLLIIASLLLFSHVSPNLWQLAMTGMISFWLAYLSVKLSRSKRKNH